LFKTFFRFLGFIQKIPSQLQATTSKMSYLAFAVLLLSSGTAQGQPTAQDCAILGTLWRKWGRQSLFPTNCCNTTGVVCSSTRVTELNWWAFIAPDTALKGPLHPELFTLTGLTAM
jgi:hypothetical protein